MIVQAEMRDRFAFCEWVDHRKTSTRKLAEAATRMAEREKGTESIKISHSTIGHLMSGHQKRVSFRRAELIERALDVPKGSLFVYKLTNVSSAERCSHRGAA